MSSCKCLAIRFVAGLFKVAYMLRALVILVPETFIPLTMVGSSHGLNEYFTKVNKWLTELVQVLLLINMERQDEN
jgi:hypothetical protein